MIYIFDKKQAIIKVLTNDDFTAAHLNFKINTATTFEFSLPASKALPSGSKYVATPHPLNDSKFIMLRLTESVDKTETIDYSAYELAYQELATDGYIEDKRPQNQSALNLMKIALNGSNWELNNVNVSGAATTNFYYVDRLSAISKVVDLLGGEIVFYIEIQGNAISGRYMDYLARQGADTSKVFASGSNLLTVERQSDTSNIYTAILPRGKGEEIDNGDANTPDGYGRRINIADVEWKKSAGKPLDKPKGSIVLSDPDATAEWGQINGNARLLIQTYDDIDDINVLINSAYKTLQSVNHPQIQYSATVADVGGLSLGDTVLIMHGDRDLSYKTRVFEVKYDLLSPDQTELSLGDDLSSNSITSQLNNLNAVADTASSQTQWTINQIGRPGTTYGATAPDSPKVGDIWFKYLPDGGTEIHRWNGDIWELLASPTTADDIATAVDDAVTQAKAHVDEVKQGLINDIATAKSHATSLANTAQQNAIDVASKSLGTYLVRLLPGTNIFKTTNSTTIQAQVWKAGQDITSTLGSASFSWKLAKDGANAISLTNNVKNITAKPSDFTNTGTYIVNVIIPVTDTTGTTRNQTFSDRVTIAKVTDGINGATGNGILSTTITYATSASGTHAPTSGYTSIIPTVNKGQFLWQRTAISYTNGTTKNSDVVTYFAKDGLKGVDGIDGGQGMIAQPSKPTSDLTDGFLWLDTSQTYPVYYIYDSSIKDFKIYQFNAKNINADQIKAKFVGTDRLSASQIIADDLHVKSAKIDGQLTASQITVSSTNGAQTSLANFNLGEMSQTISDTKNAVNNLGQINRLLNTEFNPDYAAWTAYGNRTTLSIDRYWLQNGSNNLGVYRDQDQSNYGYAIQKIAIGQNTTFSFSVNAKINSMISSKGRLYIHLRALDTKGNVISDIYKSGDKSTTYNFERFSVQNAQTPAGTTVVELAMGMYGGGSVSFNHPFFVLDSHTGNYVAGNYSNSDYLAQVKITADGISNFVRDTNGNLSSNFQTALGKMSIITGSPFATSIQEQTATRITSALTDNNKNIISLINLDTTGAQIYGKNIVLDGNTTVKGDFYAKGGNFKNLNATNITFGTLNGNQVNIANIKADNITSGAISGANLNINLNTGQVQFQKGRINSSDYTTDINIDQGYISTANDNTRALIKQGMIQLVAPNRFDLDSSPYMEISNNRGVGTAGAAIIGRDSVSIANSKNAKNIFPAPIGTETFSGLYTGQASDGGWLPTKVAGADRGVVVAGGTKTTWQIVNNSPYIWVGTDAHGSSGYGNRVFIEAEYLHATTVYNHYASGGGNVYVASDGALLKSSSATKYKTNIEHETDSIQGDQLLTIDPATWSDKFESEQLERYHEIGVEPERQINMEGKRYYGIIAEDLVKAGLEELVTRNEETDEVEGVEYSKIGVALIPIVRDLRNKLNEQAVEIERLKDKNK